MKSLCMSISLIMILFSSLAFSMGIRPPINHIVGGEIPELREVVAGKIYRSGQPTQQGFGTLARKQLRTVIDLRDESDANIAEERQTVTSLGMNFISVPLSAFLEPRDQDIDEILADIQKPELQPVLIHCLQGMDRTGLVTGLYRVEVQKVAPKNAFQEMVDDGFHPILLGLTKYFAERTHLEPSLSMAIPHHP